MKRVEEAV